MNSFLGFENKNILVTGVANKKSIAYHVAAKIIENNGQVVFSVQSEDHKEKVLSLFKDALVITCDVNKSSEIEKLALDLKNKDIMLDGFFHSIAFADFSQGMKPFHETTWEQFQQAMRISCFSFIEMAKALNPLLRKDASLVTMGISSTRATNYGFMGPIKACLESSVAFLAKSLGQDERQLRVTCVNAGPLKTAASAGIPNYIDNYLFAEKLTLRKRALETQEVANTALFLLSGASKGITGTGFLIDGGISCNYFDEEVVRGLS